MNTSQKHIYASCVLGSLIAWYDFIIFGTATALVFSQLFFPDMGYIIPMLVFAVGFLSRPLGSFIIGHIGDKIGRRKTLLATLLLTGVSSVLIGLLPTHADIGITATVLLILCRILQTFALGGEWSAASTMMLEYNVEKPNKGFIGSTLSSGLALASALSAGAWALASAWGTEFLMSWGWRIPFLFSFVLVGLGVYMRHRVLETPVFESTQKVKNPTASLLINHWPKVLLGAASTQVGAVWWYGITVFGFAYMANTLKIDRAVINQTWFYFTPLLFSALLFFGWVGDKFSRLLLYRTCAILSVLLVYPIFLLLGQGNIVLPIFLAIIVIQSMSFASDPTFFTELFPAELRQVGSGVTKSLSTLLAGGIVPLIATQLMITYNDIMYVAHLFIALSIVQVLATVMIKKHYEQRIQ